jgi:hypothetical protein
MKWSETVAAIAKQFFSANTARFILSLLALAIACYALYGLMNRTVVESNREALLLALGILLGLSKDAYNYYFGSTARGDFAAPEVKVVNPPEAPVQTENVQ